MDAVTRHRQLRLAGFDLPDAVRLEPARALSVGVVERDLAHDGDVRHLELRLLGVAVSDPPELTFEARALIAALAEFTDEARSAAFNPALHPRNPKGSPGGGRFRSLVARVLGALEAWSKGNGPDDPFEGFDREQLRQVAKHRGIPLRRGASRDEIAEALKVDVKAKVGGAKDAKPEVGKPVRFTLTGGGAGRRRDALASLSNTDHAEMMGALRQASERDPWDKNSGYQISGSLTRPEQALVAAGFADVIADEHGLNDKSYLRTTPAGAAYLAGHGDPRTTSSGHRYELRPRPGGGYNLVHITPTGEELKMRSFSAGDKRRADEITAALNAAENPKSPIGGEPDSKLRDLDVGVYTEKNGKVSLWEVSDSGERRRRVALVDDLAGLEAWADEHGESELAGWARKERAAPDTKTGDLFDSSAPREAKVQATADALGKLRSESDILAHLDEAALSRPELDALGKRLGIDVSGAKDERAKAERIAAGLVRAKKAPVDHAAAIRDLKTSAEVEAYLAANPMTVQQLRDVATALGPTVHAVGNKDALKAAIVEGTTGFRERHSVRFPEGFEGLAALGGGGAPAKAAGARVANLPPVQVHVDASSGSDVGRWRATHAEGLSGSQTALLAAVTDRVRTSGRLANGRLRTPDAPLHEQSIDELLGRVPLNAEKAAKAAAAADRHIGALDKAMEQSRLPTDAVLWRGIRPADVSLPDGDATGFEWTDPAYVGTSGTRNVAEGSFAQGALLRIAAPSGTRAIGIQGGGEHEVLLDRGLRFRVVADRRTPSGARELDVEIVGTAPDVPAKTAKKAAPKGQEGPSPDELLAIGELSSKGMFSDGGWVSATDVSPGSRRHLDGLVAKGWLQKHTTADGDLYRIDPRPVGTRQPGTGALVGEVIPAQKPRAGRLSLTKVKRGAVIEGYRGDDGSFDNVPESDDVDRSRVVRVIVQRLELLDENGQPTTALLAPNRRIIGHDADTGERVESGVVPLGSYWAWYTNPDEDAVVDIEGEVVPDRKGVTASAKATKAAKKAVDLSHLRTLDPEAARDELDLRKVDELKTLLREQELPVSGRKRELVDRLVESLAQPTREDRIKQLMLSGLTRDEAEAQLAGKSVRPSGLPAKPMSADFDDLAERLSTGTQAQVLEVLQDLNATELTKLARKFPGTAMFVPGVLKTSERRQGMRIPEGLSLEQMRQWLAKQLMDRRFQWRSTDPDDDEIERADYEDFDEDDDDPTLDEIQAMADDDERTMPLGARARELALLGVTRAAGHDVTPGRDELHHWWVWGEGRARWKTWTELYTQLAKIAAIGPIKAKRFASRWFLERYHYAAGSDINRVKHGKPPRGKRVGPG